MNKIYFLVLILFFYSCEKNEIGIESPYEGDGTQINVCFVQDGQINHSNFDVDLESLALDEKPWIIYSEIEFYDWSSHMFYLNVDKNKTDLAGKYFVVKSDEVRLFLGYFISPASSSFSYYPSITAWDDFNYSKEIVEIGGFGGFHKDTLNSNIAFKESLANSGLLKEGIDVELISLEKESASTLKYTFKVTNLDIENIYVLDPLKMGVSRFHYYSNGVSFWKDNKGYHANDFETTVSEKIKFEWYRKLIPGKSITRSVTLDGYTLLPTGIVNASFWFPSPFRLGEGNWKKNDGRIWLGNIQAQKEMIIN